MSFLTTTEAQAWGEKTKLQTALTTIDDELLNQIASEVFSQVSQVADTSTWINSATTPSIVKTILARTYVAWIIDRQYSEDADLNAYAGLLRAGATNLMNGIIASTIDIPNATATGDGLPSIYPNDTTVDSFGNPYGPYFTMDATF